MSDVKSPSPHKLKKLRTDMQLTQTQAAAKIYYSQSGWQKFELGSRKMHPALWELFLFKTNNYKLHLIK